MKIIDPSYEILTDISPYASLELMQIEKAARTCYKSEDKITDQAESAKELIKKLIDKGHEAMLEHSTLSVKFICDRGISHELVRHRMASFAQESTRYCNYSKDRFNSQITVIKPACFSDDDIPEKDEEFPNLWKTLLYCYPEEYVDKIDNMSPSERAGLLWYGTCAAAEAAYFIMLDEGLTAQEARAVLPMSLKTEIVVTANYREWRHIFDLRCNGAAHPEMRRLMKPLLNELHDLIPIIFDDLYERYCAEDKLACCL